MSGYNTRSKAKAALTSPGISAKSKGIKKVPKTVYTPAPSKNFLEASRKATNAVFSPSVKNSALPKKWGDVYRVKAENRGVFGAGYDERASTATVRDLAVANKGQGKAEVQKMVDHFSAHRSRTDHLVWNTSTGQGYAGHPGALRTNPKTTSHVAHEHGSKDIARATATKHEFQSTPGSLMDKTRQAQSRADVETIRTMSTPMEEFAALGQSTTKIHHAEFGDISQPANFKKMATTVHTAREELKWQTGSNLISQNLGGEVSPVMAQYLGAHGNNPTTAKQAFDTAVVGKTETRLNSHAQSQAGNIGGGGTLTNAPVGRARALSDARKPA